MCGRSSTNGSTSAPSTTGCPTCSAYTRSSSSSQPLWVPALSSWSSLVNFLFFSILVHSFCLLQKHVYRTPLLYLKLVAQFPTRNWLNSYPRPDVLWLWRNPYCFVSTSNVQPFKICNMFSVTIMASAWGVDSYRAPGPIFCFKTR